MKRLTRKVNVKQLKEAREIGEPFVREYKENDYCELEGTCDRDRLNKLGQLEDIEEETKIPFSKIASLKNGDKVFVDYMGIKEAKVTGINYNKLTITVLVDGKTFVDYMLFHQYGMDRKSPLHCWCGAWALTKEELL